MNVLLETNLPLAKPFKGKVRDTYDLGKKLLIIATDRISAFDAVLPCGIPEKGLVLNQLSIFWFNKSKHIIPNHFISMISNKEMLKEISYNDKILPKYLIGRSMIVHKANRINIEAVVRGYLSGSAWVEYKNNGTISNISQRKGIKESDKLSQPIFTPTTKADIGHDLPIDKIMMENQFGKELAKLIEDKSIEIYTFASEYALKKGIIIADTKFEFGLLDNSLILIDEMLTPDSSRFWDADKYTPGIAQPSFDKQPVRDWLEDSGWNKLPPAPNLPDEIINDTSKQYQLVFKMLVGNSIIK
jgi:phosphoribosylaminoimidazole-succinocarboxamide synthase